MENKPKKGFVWVNSPSPAPTHEALSNAMSSRLVSDLKFEKNQAC